MIGRLGSRGFASGAGSGAATGLGSGFASRFGSTRCAEGFEGGFLYQGSWDKDNADIYGTNVLVGFLYSIKDRYPMNHLTFPPRGNTSNHIGTVFLHQACSRSTLPTGYSLY
jgi:hypothetical protein